MMGGLPTLERSLRDQEIIPGVRVLRIRRANVVAILETELTLIDAGLPGTDGLLDRALAAHGRSIRDVRRVVLTHGHPDHAGGAAALHDVGADILLHPDDADRLDTRFRDALARPSRGRFFAAMTPQPAMTTPLADGQVLPVLGGLEVIHTPGHTPGSVCLWAARDGVLFVGDVLNRRFGKVGFASRLYSDDHAAARRAVQRLAGLGVSMVVFGHYPPLADGAAALLEQLAARA